MHLSTPFARRGMAVLGASTLVATLAVAVGPLDEADAAHPCRIATTASLDSSTRFAGGGMLRRYTATAQGAAKGGYNQQGKVDHDLVPIGCVSGADQLPDRRSPGDRRDGHRTSSRRRWVRSTVTSSSFPTSATRHDIEMSRGPMIKDGRVIRAHQRPAAGRRHRHQPAAVRWSRWRSRAPSLRSSRTAQPVPIVGVNWHTHPQRRRQPLHDRLEQRAA